MSDIKRERRSVSPEDNENGKEDRYRRSRSRSPRQRSDDKRRSRSRDRERSRPIRINDPDAKKVYVSNLPYDFTWKKLKELFREEIGEEAYVDIYTDDIGKSKGVAVCEFRRAEGAMKAIEKLHKHKLGDRNIIVRRESARDRQRHSDVAQRKLAEQQQRALGMLGAAPLRGGGMVSSGPSINISSSASGINPALLQQLGIDGPLTNKLFVANLDYKVSERKLQEVFGMAGRVLGVELKRDKDGNSRGYCVVTFESPTEAVNGIAMFNKQMLYDRTMEVRMDKAPASLFPERPRLPAGLKSVGRSIDEIGSRLNPAPLAVSGALSGFGAAATGISGLGGIGPGLTSAAGGIGGTPSIFGAASPLDGRSLGTDRSALGGGPSVADRYTALERNRLSASLDDFDRPLGGGISGMGGGGVFDVGNDLGRSGSLSSRGGLDLGYTGRSDMGRDLPRDLGPRGDISGRPVPGVLGVRPGGNSRGSGPGTELLIKNLPYNYTWKQLKDRFSVAGNVQYAEMKTHQSGKPLGIGIVRFDQSEDARRARALLDGTQVEGRRMIVRDINDG